jgi:hypothetical protein
MTKGIVDSSFSISAPAPFTKSNTNNLTYGFYIASTDLPAFYQNEHPRGTQQLFHDAGVLSYFTNEEISYVSSTLAAIESFTALTFTYTGFTVTVHLTIQIRAQTLRVLCANHPSSHQGPALLFHAEGAESRGGGWLC